MIRGDCMDRRIHVDFVAVEATSTLLHDFKVGPGDESGLDLSIAGSDLVASAAEVFAGGWSDALGFLSLACRRLAGGLDGALADFLAGEHAHLDSLATSIGALER